MRIDSGCGWLSTGKRLCTCKQDQDRLPRQNDGGAHVRPDHFAKLHPGLLSQPSTCGMFGISRQWPKAEVLNKTGLRCSGERSWLPVVDALRTLATCPPPSVSALLETLILGMVPWV